MLTKKCSLKCKGCMNMSNNLFDKEDYDLNLFENDIKHLSSLNINFDHLILIGGEPFELDNLKNYILIIYKYINKKIYIHTNGLRLLSFKDLDILRNVTIRITKYSIFKSYYFKLEKFLQKNNIKYEYHNPQPFFKDDRDEFYRMRTTVEEHFDSAENYKKCINKCPYLFNSKLYSCPIAMTVCTRNKYFGTNYPEEYININDIRSQNDFENILKPIDLCKFCTNTEDSLYKHMINTKIIKDDYICDNIV